MTALLIGLTTCLAGCANDAHKRSDGTPAAGPHDRTGLVTMRGKPLTLVGPAIKAGDAAPAFQAVANDMSAYAFDPMAGKVYIVAAVPSLDTAVCSAETKRFNEEAGKLGADVTVITVSRDLPFAQKRWCGAEGIKNVQTVSDFRDRDFGRKYGVDIKETGLLARAVFVVGKDGKVAYAQIVPDITQEPDYAPAINAAKAAAGKS